MKSVNWTNGPTTAGHLPHTNLIPLRRTPAASLASLAAGAAPLDLVSQESLAPPAALLPAMITSTLDMDMADGAATTPDMDMADGDLTTPDMTTRLPPVERAASLAPTQVQVMITTIPCLTPDMDTATLDTTTEDGAATTLDMTTRLPPVESQESPEATPALPAMTTGTLDTATLDTTPFGVPHQHGADGMMITVPPHPESLGNLVEVASLASPVPIVPQAHLILSTLHQVTGMVMGGMVDLSCPRWSLPLPLRAPLVERVESLAVVNRHSEFRK